MINQIEEEMISILHHWHALIANVQTSPEQQAEQTEQPIIDNVANIANTLKNHFENNHRLIEQLPLSETLE